MKKNLMILFVVLFLYSLSSCELVKNDVSDLIERNDLKWGMDSTSFKKVINKNSELSLLCREVLASNASYIYLGGVLKNISLKGIKFLFKENLLVGMEIWVDSKSKQEMESKYAILAKYFNSIGKLEFNASNDAWIYCKDKKDNESRPDTDIFLVSDGNNILVHIHKTYVTKESIFIN